MPAGRLHGESVVVDVNKLRRRLQKSRAAKRANTFTVRAGGAVHTVTRERYRHGWFLRFDCDTEGYHGSKTLHFNNAGHFTSVISSWSDGQIDGQLAHDEMRAAQARALRIAIGRGWHDAVESRS